MIKNRKLLTYNDLLYLEIHINIHFEFGISLCIKQIPVFELA